jgi:hypothetical protein
MFYRSANLHLSVSQRIKVMDKECLRWHPDKMKHLVSHVKISDGENADLLMVAGKVIEIRKEVKG